MKILLTGITGLVGAATALRLVRDGHEIIAVSRNVESAKLHSPFPAKHVSWYEIDAGKVDEVDAVIHLAGESVFGGRWSAERKKNILASRVESTRSLVKAFKKNGYWPKVWINGSAIGFYGSRRDELLTEESRPGSDFLANVCQTWEESTTGIPNSCRLVYLRTGVVLAKRGGAFATMLPAFRAGVAGRLGSGQQWMSWIHLEDLVGSILFILGHESLKGPVNAVAPEPVINRIFTSELSRKLKRPAILPIPSFALKLAGEISTLFLNSQRVSPEKLLANGFEFQFGNLSAAFKDLVDFEAKAGVHEVFQQQWIAKPTDQVFAFFCDEKNLEQLTPESLKFKVVHKSTPELQEGTLIDYQLKIRGVPAKWRTKILSWQAGRRFVDTQLQGPYAIWHHTHEFEGLAGGTLMTDRVLYKLPLWPLGNVALPLVAADVRAIFQFRRKVVQSLFGK